jgi:formylglycine-generating enzyme required for sulfatase activity
MTATREIATWLGDFVELDPAEFLMGAAADDRYATTAERPSKRVKITHRYAIGVFLVTEDQWDFQGPGTLPKVRVSWNDIQAWLSKAREQSGLPLRLPTEIEWEYAARAGSTGGFPNGETISPTEANFLHDDLKNIVGPGHLTPRGTYPPNAFGLEDMLGNVAEWTADAWSPDTRVVRSAGWDSLPLLLRLSARHPLPTDRRQDNLGFRLAFDLP